MKWRNNRKCDFILKRVCVCVFGFFVCAQRHDGQCETECSSVPAAPQQNLPRPCAHGRVDGSGGSPTQRPASGNYEHYSSSSDIAMTCSISAGRYGGNYTYSIVYHNIL